MSRTFRAKSLTVLALALGLSLLAAPASAQDEPSPVPEAPCAPGESPVILECEFATPDGSPIEGVILIQIREDGIVVDIEGGADDGGAPEVPGLDDLPLPLGLSL